MNTVQSVNAPDTGAYINDTRITSADDNKESFDKVLENSTRTLEDIFRDVSEEYGVPLSLLKAVAQAESGFDANAVSSCGASGIMQLMPKTAEGLGVEDVFNPEQNITGGAKMLAYLLDDYDGDTTLALAAYNAGSGAVAKYGGVPPYEETRNYIKRINDILDGGLEADLSYIEVNQPDTGAVQPANSYKTVGKQAPLTIAGNERNNVRDIFSYDGYLRFVEIYMKMMDAILGEEDSDEEAVRNSTDEKLGEQQRLYEIERAQMGLNVQSLFYN